MNYAVGNSNPIGKVILFETNTLSSGEFNSEWAVSCSCFRVSGTRMWGGLNPKYCRAPAGIA